MKSTKIVKALYVFAGLVALLFVYLFGASIAYLVSYSSSYGMSVTDLGMEAVSYVITESIVYLIYAVLIATGAKILDTIQKNCGCKCECECEEECACGCGCDGECEEDEAEAEEAEAEEESACEETEKEVEYLGPYGKAPEGFYPVLYTSKLFM